jgi:hypothetical protein
VSYAFIGAGAVELAPRRPRIRDIGEEAARGPSCIPERFRQAAENWCVRVNTVQGLGAVDWNLPEEYMDDPCRSARLPACLPSEEPAMTLPPPVTQTTPAVTEAELAVARPNYLMWGILGAAVVAGAVIWRASK